MNENELINKLEICLNALAIGADLDTCIKLFPDDKADLLPLLQAASKAQKAAFSDPKFEQISRSRTRVLGAAEKMRNKKTANVFGMRVPRVLLATVLVLLLLVFGTGGLLATSAQALPGDQTYPLKLVVENLRLQFESDNNMRSDLEENINQRRVSEIQHLLDIGRSVPVSFIGKVEQINGDFWIVKDILLKVDANINIIGPVKVGDVIQIDGNTSEDGWVNADLIRLDASEVVGFVSEISKDGVFIDGTFIGIDTDTQFDPRISAGDRVIALIEATNDGRIKARAILKYLE